jgi:hypothetical protein
MLAIIGQAARDPNVDIGKMERLWDMYRQMCVINAEVEYAKSMSTVQSHVPAIEKKAKNLQTNSKYAKLEHICEKLTPIATENGFSISYGTDKADLEGDIRTTAIVYHSGGHKTHHHVDLPLDNVGIKGSVNKTAVHARKSSHTYGRTILQSMIFNVSTVEVDDDGNASGGEQELINEKQLADITALLDELTKEKKQDALFGLFKWLKIESVDQIPSNQYDKAIKAIEARRK